MLLREVDFTRAGPAHMDHHHVGAEHAEARVLPPDQGLEAERDAVAEPDERLELD